MKNWFLFWQIISIILCLYSDLSVGNIQRVSQIKPGFQATQMEFVDHNGRFLVSNNSNFSFGFHTTVDAPLCVLVVMHVLSSTNIWTANRGNLVGNSDEFVFDENGNAYLMSNSSVIWSTFTAEIGVQVMELKDNGNLVLLSQNQTILWQSFDHPTDTLILGQNFSEGMILKSIPNDVNLFYYLKMESGDLILYAGYETRQVYWSMSNDSRKAAKKSGSNVSFATLTGNKWDFYDQRRDLVWQFNISLELDSDALLTAVIGSSGTIQFFNLLNGKPEKIESTRIPHGSCSSPSSCDAYNSCFMENQCKCPASLSSFTNCKPRLPKSCNVSKNLLQMFDVGSSFDYPAIPYTKPQIRSSLTDCKTDCISSCSCITMFYENSSRSCFMFSQIGSLKQPDFGANGYYLSIKVLNDETSSGLFPVRGLGMEWRATIIIAIGTFLIISGVISCGLWYYSENSKLSVGSPEEDGFENVMAGMPIRYRYSDLQVATNRFSVKLGQGGFGSVYSGALNDGEKVAVKQLERVGQGEKEFRAEVSIIGGVHHVHLVKLKGFCSEGVQHRLLVYEYMENGSLDKWIFNKNNKLGVFLDWETRFNIAVGTAKGLAYLHEDCDVKIIHCDIKPENVLLDENFVAKVSDFGLARLMSKEESQVVTTLRGTRGYLAPEWITNCCLSEKSDVYSFGMVLFEIISGRKNYDPKQSEEKRHLPSYAFSMMQQEKLAVVVDARLKGDHKHDKTIFVSIKVALWCIQDEISLRPTMSRVVQMLEGLSPVPEPPIPSESASRIYSCLYNSEDRSKMLKWTGSFGSDTSVSDVQLSGPR